MTHDYCRVAAFQIDCGSQRIGVAHHYVSAWEAASVAVGDAVIDDRNLPAQGACSAHDGFGVRPGPAHEQMRGWRKELQKCPRSMPTGCNIDSARGAALQDLPRRRDEFGGRGRFRAVGAKAKV